MAYIPRRYAIPDSDAEGRRGRRQMNPTEIEFAVRDLVSKPYDPASFPYDLIGLYNASMMTISRIKNGTMNKAKQPGDILWQKQLFFRPVATGEEVGAVGDGLVLDPLIAKYKPRFILVTDGKQVHIRDLKFDESENIEYERLDEQSYFLLPLAGYERRAIVEEHPADIKAAKKLKKLYDAILAANPTWSTGNHAHELNLLMTRLLFCFYAEDTAIFDTPQIFTNTVTQQTSEDGSDVAALLDRLFRIMNVEEAARSKGTPAVDARFPYVNGSLFEDTVEIPRFSRTARRQLLECGDLDWTTISPDIFGSMIQTIAQDGTRSDLGMHYTSVPNIMKVLQPLFLDDLKEAYEKAKESVPKLEALLGRLSKIRVFDPACGSGNFLIIAYRELRKLEIDILKRIGDLSPRVSLPLSNIALPHFYGIDKVDFACETAKLSLWIAEHQMNSTFRDSFGTERPTLPLSKISTIHCGNATRLNYWLEVCPQSEIAETYICGNPPYQGSIGQTVGQKNDITAVFEPILTNYRDVDYVACWFIRLTQYIIASTTTRGAFVATNSITQGEQVPFLWPYILSNGLAIFMAHRSFTWSNSASHNAGVTCVIVGLARMESIKKCSLYSDDHCQHVDNINPYLIPGTTRIVVKERTSLGGLPEMTKGSVTNDKGHLTLSRDEANALKREYAESAQFIHRFYGADELLYDTHRYVLWITDDTLKLANSIPPIRERIERVRRHRLTGGSSARATAHVPYRFGFTSYRALQAIVIPQTSSERRNYLPVALLQPSDIPSQKLCVIYDQRPFILAILSSRLHLLWLATIGGRMRTDFSYSNTLVYNTFPVPALSNEQQRALAEYSKTILGARARHPGKTLAWLYNPETMPQNVLETHQQNDIFLEEHIYGRKFKDDTERLGYLFAMYARMKEAAAHEGTLLGKVSQKKAV